MKPRHAFHLLVKNIPGITQEFKFHPKRKFRADYAIPDKMILIEYDGLMSSKSRHTTVSGFTRDCEKMNLAAQLGYRVFRYTALNYANVVGDLNEIIIQNQNQNNGRNQSL